jgi:hypothetical protein
VRSNPNAKKIIEKFCALALLPANHIFEGFQLLKTEADEFPEFSDFLKYFESFWIVKVC